MKKEIEVKKYEKKANLTEVYQKSGLLFAFLSAPRDGSAQCHPYVKCREFLNDAVRASVKKEKCNIYGFIYDPKDDPKIDTMRTRLLLKHPDISKKAFAELINNGVKLLHHYENIMSLKVKTSVYKSTDGDYIINSSNVWLKSPILTSTFSLLFRIAELKPEFDLGDNTSLIKAYEKIISSVEEKIKYRQNKDAFYLSKIYNKLHVVLENYESLCDLRYNTFSPIICESPSNFNYHDNSGIVALCTDKYPDKITITLLKQHIDDEKVIKKFLKVTSPYSSGVYTSYQPQSLQMALVSSVDDKRTQIIQFNGCRESILSYYRGKYKQFDDQKIRLLVRIPGILRDNTRMNTHKKELFFAKRVLNFYEKKFGIKKSVISTVMIRYTDTIQYGWLFTGDPEWLANPVMLTAYMMIVRAAKGYMYNNSMNDKVFIKPKKIDDSSVENMWKLLHDSNKYRGFADRDLYSRGTNFNKLMLNRKKIFDYTKTIEQAYYISTANKVIDENFGMYYTTRAGVNSLLNGTHIDKKLVRKFEEIVAKNE